LGKTVFESIVPRWHVHLLTLDVSWPGVVANVGEHDLRSRSREDCS
jgi:hypothetical protein